MKKDEIKNLVNDTFLNSVTITYKELPGTETIRVFNLIPSPLIWHDIDFMYQPNQCLKHMGLDDLFGSYDPMDFTATIFFKDGNNFLDNIIDMDYFHYRHTIDNETTLKLFLKMLDELHASSILISTQQEEYSIRPTDTWAELNAEDL